MVTTQSGLHGGNAAQHVTMEHKLATGPVSIPHHLHVILVAATAKDQEMRRGYALSKLVPVSLMSILVLYTDRVIQFK